MPQPTTRRFPTRHGLATAATAIAHGATLWTLNRDDFAGIAELELGSAGDGVGVALARSHR